MKNSKRKHVIFVINTATVIMAILIAIYANQSFINAYLLYLATYLALEPL